MIVLIKLQINKHRINPIKQNLKAILSYIIILKLRNSKQRKVEIKKPFSNTITNLVMIQKNLKPLFNILRLHFVNSVFIPRVLEYLI